MSETTQPNADNPFSSRWIRPGAIPFFFPAGHSAETLLERLRQNGWRGQIVGPHGSGKSTLLATLLPRVEQTGRRVQLVVLHDRQRRLPIDLGGNGEPTAPTLLVVDGYEQLSSLSRLRVRRACRRRGSGLLVTAHTPVGLPDLFRTTANLDAARQIVQHLLADRQPAVDDEDLRRRLEQQRGNLRELLFDLYDLYETRR